ncbi:ATP-binding response regulator [Methylotenera sp. N17]|uniref:ATP-binding response regulator n=1 Tax=Methylotenera sp. N17 TaxID=1502761 RepID=UPI00190F6C1C|nr:hybrid sensor histidine kinase/response regulator [Methylotenera sp. N17]
MAEDWNKVSQNNSLKFDQLTEDGQMRLIDLGFHSLVFGISSIPFCAVALTIWAYTLKVDTLGLIVWGSFYMFAAIGIRLFRKTYQINRKQNNHTLTPSKWLAAINGVTFTHGIGLTLPFFIFMGKVPFEFNLLYLVTVAAIIAAFATHLTPILTAFFYLFIPCWSICIFLMPWIFPSHWPILIFLGIIYAISMYRHALLGHQFFLKQITLEDEGAKLAENYRIAKIAAENALQAKNQFLTTASHDLRQPVHAMGFLIESIARRNQDKLIEPALKDLKQSVRSVTQMFNALLDLSKIELGQVKLSAGNVYLDGLIQEIATLFNEEAHAKNLDIRTRHSGGNAMVNVDGTLLHQSVMNLMHNALRYTKQGGVLMAVRKRGVDWQIDVWDTGVGVASEDSSHIFSPFYRNKHAWRIDSAGHGLGLAVVARCCEMMGCQYGFRSRLNRGSHFWLRLPAMTGSLQSVRIMSETTSPAFKSDNSKLSGTCLIVDDDPQVITAWESLLNTWGVSVRCVESGKQALEVIDAGFTPNAILCDQRLRAGESGFDVLRNLLERCPEASGAMVSGEFNSPELIEAENEGYLVLHKPLEPEVLFTLLSRWLVKSES